MSEVYPGAGIHCDKCVHALCRVWERTGHGVHAWDPARGLYVPRGQGTNGPSPSGLQKAERRGKGKGKEQVRFVFWFKG
jgi:hypothetical protein